MKSPIFSLFLAFLSLCFALSGINLRAQGSDPKPITVTAEIASPTAGALQEVQFSLIIQGAVQEQPTPPQLTLPEGLTARHRGQQRSMISDLRSGVTQIKFTFNYALFGEKKGTYLIPPQTVEIDGKTYKTLPVELVITDTPDVSKDEEEAQNQFLPTLTIRPAKTSVYSGERVPLEIELKINRFSETRNFGLLEMERNNFAVRRFPERAEYRGESSSGNHAYLSFNTTFVGLQPGTHVMGPASLEVDFVSPNRSRPRSIFDSPYSPRRINIKSDKVPIEIKALPEENKPAAFKGAVGDFTLEVSAEPSEVSQGEPINVEIVIRGDGNFEAVACPEPMDSKGWKLYQPRQTSPKTPQDQDEYERRYTRTITPLEIADRLPEFQFAFFDPNAEKYVVLTSPPIPIKVHPGIQQTAPDQPASNDLAASQLSAPAPAAAPQPEVVLQDIVDPGNEPLRWIPRTFPLSTLKTANLSAAALLILLIFGNVTWKWITRHRPRHLKHVLADLRKNTRNPKAFSTLLEEATQRIPFAIPYTTDEDRIRTRLAAYLYAPKTASKDIPLPQELLSLYQRLAKTVKEHDLSKTGNPPDSNP